MCSTEITRQSQQISRVTILKARLLFCLWRVLLLLQDEIANWYSCPKSIQLLEYVIPPVPAQSPKKTHVMVLTLVMVLARDCVIPCYGVSL